jgi:hypothetical protein
MIKKEAPKTRSYKLTRNAAPLSFVLQSRSTKRRALLYFDPEKNVNRPIRYAVNQKTPFQDEQDDHALVEPIIFENGFLQVPATNPVLQEFLSLHPDLGKKFVEVDGERDAVKEIESLTAETDAMSLARDMSLDQLETVARVLIGRDISLMKSAEIRRDVLVYAKRNPVEFLDIVNDPDIELQSKVARMFEEKFLSLRNHGRDVHFNLKDNKRRMISIPHGAKKYEFVAQFLKSDEGLDTLRYLETQMGDQPLFQPSQTKTTDG